MTSDEVAQFHHILETQLNDLKTIFADRPHDLVAGPIADENDLASRESEQAFGIKIKDRQRELLREIQAALFRIEHGNYGDCQACGEQITIKRLKVAPTSLFCVPCKSERESKHEVLDLRRRSAA